MTISLRMLPAGGFGQGGVLPLVAPSCMLHVIVCLFSCYCFIGESLIVVCFRQRRTLSCETRAAPKTSGIARSRPGRRLGRPPFRRTPALYSPTAIFDSIFGSEDRGFFDVQIRRTKKEVGFLRRRGGFFEEGGVLRRRGGARDETPEVRRHRPQACVRQDHSEVRWVSLRGFHLSNTTCEAHANTTRGPPASGRGQEELRHGVLVIIMMIIIIIMTTIILISIMIIVI